FDTRSTDIPWCAAEGGYPSPLPASQSALHDLQRPPSGRYVLRGSLCVPQRVSLPVREHLASSHPASGPPCLLWGETYPGCARADDTRNVLRTIRRDAFRASLAGGVSIP